MPTYTLRGRPPIELPNLNLNPEPWPLTFELKIDTPVVPDLRNVRANFVFFYAFQLSS